jgi:coenzyme F420 hydrogenase subunit beta
MSESVYAQLQREVIDAGLCTHCGTCVGVSDGRLQMKSTSYGPLPAPTTAASPPLPEIAYTACPGREIDYPAAFQAHFGALPENWLLGPARQTFIGYAADAATRRGGASGGVITQTLLYLLENGRIDGAVVVQMGDPKPWLARPIIAATPEQIRAASQSVYQPVPVNVILPEMDAFNGRLAYVGLPDQVAALRRLQREGHPAANKVDYVLGPYVGTNLYLGAIESYLRSNGVSGLEEITDLQYRAGEWPGYLQIKLRSGRVLRAEKFYYNYLIPFYLTRGSLTAVDFTNELTDISVGDAWHPRYEEQGAGFSVVVARSGKGEALLDDMAGAGVVHLDPVPPDEALSMHGHMLDFKKRGAFIRLGWLAERGLPTPNYGYHPAHIGRGRRLVEAVIVTLFWICGAPWARRLVEFVPLGIIGPLFNVLRKSWKRLSKPVKRKGLGGNEYEVVITGDVKDEG